MPFSDAIRIGASGAGDYEVRRSLRFNRGDSAYLTRSQSTPTNAKKATVSTWLKRTDIGTGNTFLEVGYQGTTDRCSITLLDTTDGNKLGVFQRDSSGIVCNLSTTQVFRDPSAWFHVVVAFDTTQSTAADRVKIYINGSQVTSFDSSVYYSQNHDLTVGSGYNTNIGYYGAGSNYYGGYMAEVNFIDGQQLTPSSFAETNSDTGQWVPIETSGLTFGTNGFRLKFADNSGTTATTLGKDSSGNGNNFTPNNFGTGDAVKDSPTNNFCTFIGLLPSNSNITLSQGNLFMDVNDSHKTTYGTHGLRSGKWYWEGRAVLASGYQTTKWTYGVSDVENTQNTQTTNTNYLLAVDSATYSKGDAVSIYNTNLYKNGSTVSSSYQTNPSAGDIIGIALDVDAGKVWFARNGTWINGSATASTTLNESSHDTTVTTGKVYTPAFTGESADWQVNFGQDSSFANGATAQGNTDGSGQGDFYYAVPSGFKAICSANLPDPTILLPNKHFDTLLYTGNNGTQNITGLDFNPDWVWGKNRQDAGYHHDLYDTVRGDNLRIFTSQTNAESTGYLQFGVTGGFSLTAGGGININAKNHVAWCWNAGGSTATNTDGTISAQVRANTSAGFSIVSYTGTGADATVGHGLGVTPSAIIIKDRDRSVELIVKHKNLSSGKVMYLNLTEAEGAATGTNNGIIADLSSSSTFSITRTGNTGNYNNVGVNGEDYIAYVFSEVSSFSKFGSYTGNGSDDGFFLFLGFKPAWFMVKMITGSEDWPMYDNKRDPFNVGDHRIFANTSGAEGAVGQEHFDFVSNGVKCRKNKNPFNASGSTYIYFAFAESPFKYARAR